MRFLLALAVCLGAIELLTVAPARADVGPAALEHVSSLVGQADRASGSARATLISEALAAIRTDPDLNSNDWLTAPLIATPPDLSEEQLRLDAAIDGARAPNQPGPPDARANLTSVLEDPRFHPRTWLDLLPGFLVPLALILSSIVQVLIGIVRWPFDRLLDVLALAIQSPVFAVAVGLAALAVVLSLVWLYRSGLRSVLVAQAEAPPSKEDVPATSADALASARERAASGEYRAACHHVLLATLLWLDEAGLARFDRSATNREQVARLATAEKEYDRRLVDALARLTGQFDRVFYGQALVAASDYADLLALAERVRETRS